MNEKIKRTVRDFMSVVKDTEEYRNYNREKERIMKHPELKRRIDEFRIRNYEVQNLSDEEEIFEIANSYMDALDEGSVKQYWEKF